MADLSLPSNEYVDPNLRVAVSNVANAAINMETDPDIAIAKGQLKIEKPAQYNYGSPLNDAIMKKAMNKFYDPEISAGMQKYSHVLRKSDALQNAANNVIGLYRLDKQAEEITRQRKAAEDSQRASVISSVLGLGGAVAGYAMAGPVGGAVGSQAGSMAGSQGSQGTGYLGANTKF